MRLAWIAAHTIDEGEHAHGCASARGAGLADGQQRLHLDRKAIDGYLIKVKGL
jgi:hypothetical protein